jgi:hypothetical protein
VRFVVIESIAAANSKTKMVAIVIIRTIIDRAHLLQKPNACEPSLPGS